MCGRQLSRDEVFTLILEVHGPKSEEDMRKFREALQKLLEGHKIVRTEIRYRVD